MHILLLSRRVFVWIFGVLALCIFATSQEVLRLPDGRVHLWMMDVGQGDSLLLQSPSGRQVLFDGGPDLSALERLNEVLPRIDTSIDLLVLSHPHLDHLAAFPEILRRYDVGAVMFTGMEYPGERYEEMLKEIREQKIPVILPNPKKDIDFGDGLILDVIAPDGEKLFGKKGDEDDANNTSVVVRALFENDSILFTGDMEEPQENDVLRKGFDIAANVLKAAHHGSKTSTSTGFLLAANPELTLISAGRQNKFRHPDQLVLDRLTHFEIPYRMTKAEGTIHLSW